MWQYTGLKEYKTFLLSLRLFDCDNENKYIKTLYALANDTKNNYQTYRLPKKSGGTRTIHAPKPLLKHIQHRILKTLLEERRLAPWATAYRRNLSLRDNASVHLQKDMILKLDITSFFDSISFLDVYESAFPERLFPKPIGMLLTALCTYDGHLVQGAPTSPLLSNLVMRETDYAIGHWCQEKGISYTRYCDDMTFSGRFTPSEVIRMVRKQLYKHDMELNNKKIHVVKKTSRQLVTGITVNEKMQVPLPYRKKVRQEIYFLRKYGLHSHLQTINWHDTPELYLDSLKGRISFILQIDPANREFSEYRDYLKNKTASDF